MVDRRSKGESSFSLRALIVLVIGLAVAVGAMTWISIRDSREDSYELLVGQGVAFTEVLARACENAIVAGTFFDRLAEERYGSLAAALAEEPLEAIDDDRMLRFVRTYGILGAYVFDSDSTLRAGASGPGGRPVPPDWVIDEVEQLIAKPDVPFVLLIDQDQDGDDAVHYHLSLTNRLDRIIVIAASAHYHTLAMERTGIGYLVQQMAREQGVEYIIYHTREGIIFSSRSTGSLLAIESDPFLTDALQSDTVSSRVYDFQGKNVLELVRPFATEDYPIGLFRVGLSLDRFYAISRGFDQRMVLLAIALFALLVLALLYLNSRRRRHQITRAYSEMKSLTDKLLDEMRTGVAAVNPDGEISLANQAFEKILDVRDSVGRRWDDVLGDPRVACAPFLESRKPVEEKEIERRTKDESRDLWVIMSRIEGAGEAVMVAVIYDITRLRVAERRSIRRERLSELGNLAAGVAHEIRNPLNTISIAAQRLASEFTPTDDVDGFREFTRTIRSETSRLNEIITRFLALAREQKAGLSSVDLGRVIEDSVRLLRPEAENMGIEIVSSVEADLKLDANPDRLREVLLNLFNNAKEALNGTPGRISIRAYQSPGGVVIRFGDSGPGIPEAQRDRVFTPYFTTKDSGTGLGLPTVHAIVTEIGGEVHIEQSELGGAEFVLEFSKD
ncbi:PAS domain-containing protein [bacterium]|nr:PAS domain-containing protein [bacterium]MCB2201697.1 PAS domain-containing protein [bacterium]